MQKRIIGEIEVIEDRIGVYTVKKGETLCEVLRKTGNSVKDISALNPELDIFNLSSGEALYVKINKSSEKGRCIVEEGEGLSDLAKRTGLSWLELLKLNPELRPSEFTAGQAIYIGNR